MIALALARSEDLEGSEFDFNRLAFDARHYVPLGSIARVLALRFFTSLHDTHDGGRVPFYFQEALGGSEMLRGFRELRFQNLNLIYLSAEYRWEAVPALEFALFYDTGKVFGDHADFSLENLEDSYGFGVRFKAPGAMVFRIDTARSREGTRIYFKFGSAAF